MSTLVRTVKKIPNYKKRKYRYKKKRNVYKKRTVMISRSIHEVYPPVLRTRLTAMVPFLVNPVSGGIDGNAFFTLIRGNGLIAIGPAQAGSSVAFSTYSNNYPGGINYLLGNFSPGGVISNAVTAPYSRYLVIKSWITVKFTEELGANNHVVRAVLLPVNNDPQPLALGISQAVGNLREQNYSKDVLVPIVVTSSRATQLKNSISVKKIYGINKNLTTDDSTFVGNYSSDPLSAFTWLFAMNNVDPSVTSSYVFTCEAVVTYDVLFFARNVMKSVAPT